MVRPPRRQQVEIHLQATAEYAVEVLRLSRVAGLGAANAYLLFAWIALLGPTIAGAEEAAGANDPNTACALCHREIYERYRKAPMANASGPAIDGLIPADFTHAASGVHYRVFEQAGSVWLSFERPNAPVGRELNGRRELRYFLGSGRRGRTYLFEQQGYWFEAPINWYAKKQMWDMTPNYLEAREMPLTLPVDPGCLRCHASQAAASLKDARNHYASAPFAAGGIACGACHGDGTAHAASGGKVPMIQINKLEPVRRDSICLSCHLEGQVAVVRAGKQLIDFAPGDNLFDYALFFVRSGETGLGERATSQWEALLKSACKQKSGDRMTCTTCHDPHGSPSAAQRVAFYRERCLRCHSEPEFATNHHQENPDCTACHMARPASSDIAHEQVTDHQIVKFVFPGRAPSATTGPLMPVGGFVAADRDLGLAYAQMAARGGLVAGNKALALLKNAEMQSAGAPNDHELHAQLGFLEQVDGKANDAAREYRDALDADPFDELAAGNLALIEAQRHRYAEAVSLWMSVFEHDPAQSTAGLNLAIVECGNGQRERALDSLDRLLSFAPDDGKARSMQAAIRSGAQKCVNRVTKP